MNVIERLEYELAYYDSAVQYFIHFTTRTPPNAGVKTLKGVDNDKPKSGINNRRKNFSWCENLERYFSGSFSFAIIICNSNDSTQLDTYEEPWMLQIY